MQKEYLRDICFFSFFMDFYWRSCQVDTTDIKNMNAPSAVPATANMINHHLANQPKAHQSSCCMKRNCSIVILSLIKQRAHKLTQEICEKHHRKYHGADTSECDQ